MLCEICKKREATILVTEIVNGVKKDHEYCAQCAPETDLKPLLDVDFPLARLLSGLLGVGAEEDDENQEYAKVVCPTCHQTYSKFVKNSQFGCPDCYETFGLLMESSIKNIQGSCRHTGKHPKFSPEQINTENNQAEEKNDQDQIVLESKLKEALADEDYEQAAYYRDCIKSLKKEREAHE